MRSSFIASNNGQYQILNSHSGTPTLGNGAISTQLHIRRWGNVLAIFRIRIDEGTYVLKGTIEKRLGEPTEYVIVAENKEAAKSLASKFIGDKAGLTSPRITHAIFDDLGDWLEHWQPLQHYKLVTDMIEAAGSFIGSINIDGVVIVCPAHELDTLIVSLSEEKKARVMVEILAAKEEGPEWGQNLSPLNLSIFVKAVQAMF